MGMPEATARYTAEMVQALPEDGNRYEVVHGELLVTPAPAPLHQVVLRRLMRALEDYLEPLGRGETVFPAPADISWDDDTLVQPDISVVAPEEVSPDWRTFRTLLLAVEIVSPSSARADRLVKRRLYQERRVATYWVVDPDARLVEVWHPEDERPAIVSDTLRWQVEPEAPELLVKLAELFRPLG